MAFATKSVVTSHFLTGKQVSVARPSARRPARPARPVTAKYGEESQYFDLDDLENTVGSWEMYGVEDSKRYPALQSEFFERAAAPFTRRESIYTFLAAIGGGSILFWGGKGSKDAQLPITRAPEKPAAIGPRGRI